MEPARPSSRLALLLLVLLGGVVLLHHEVLLRGLVYHMDDAADGYYPSHVAIWRALREGHLPTWERGAWSGFPLLSDPYYGALYPLTAIFFALGAVRGLGFTIALHTLIAGTGMLLLLRRRGLADGPALLGAVTLAFCTFMVERIRHIIFPELLAWLPWVLLGVEIYLRQGTRQGLLLVAGALGLLLLCGGLPLLPFVALLLLSYVLPRVLLGPADERRLPRARALLMLALAAGCGALLGMAQVVPTLAHLPQSPRSLGTDYQFASSYAWPAPRYLGTLLLPNLYGGAQRELWFGAYNHWEMAGYYAGALGVLLAPLGLLRRRAELFGLALCGVLAIGLSFGDAGPLQRWFFYHVPLYGALRCPPRALVMYLFAVPVLCAEGLTWVLARTSRRAGTGALLVVAGILLAAVAAGVWLWRVLPPPGPQVLRVFVQRDLRHLYLVLGAGALAIGLRLLWRLPARAAAGLVAATALVDLLVHSRSYVQPRPADFAAGTERFAAVDWLIAQHPQDRFVPEASGPFRLLNLGLTYDLQSAGGYDSYTIWRYVHLLYIINNGAVYPYEQLRSDPAAGTIKRFRTPLIDLLNIRWAIATAPPAPDWVERFRPAPGAQPAARYEPAWDPQLRVYENPHPLQRAFVVYQAKVLTDDRAQARAMLDLDPRRTVILDRAPSPPPEGGATAGSQYRQPTPARLVQAQRDRLVIEADPPVPGVLVVSEASYPGWSATLDGVPVPLLRADYAFRGVALPAGHHLVEMKLRSRPVELGLGLSALGLVGLLGLSLWRRDKRSG